MPDSHAPPIEREPTTKQGLVGADGGIRELGLTALALLLLFGSFATPVLWRPLDHGVLVISLVLAPLSLAMLAWLARSSPEAPQTQGQRRRVAA